MKDSRRAGSSLGADRLRSPDARAPASHAEASAEAEAPGAKAADPAVAVNTLLDRKTVERLYRKARADKWSLPTEAFAAALESSARKAFASEPVDLARLDQYLDGLHLEDLALACACAQGSEAAWEHFVREHRPVLYRAADAIDPSGGSRDLADSLYGELFGLDVRDGERRSHFRYFHGRSSLATWLRAVLSQRHVDRIRSVRRLDPLPEDEAPGAIAAPREDIDPKTAEYVTVMRSSVTSAVATLEPRDRLRLRCYYAQNLTLMQIGRMLNESEATASRHLGRIRRQIRTAVERQLRDLRMRDAEIADCFASVAADSASLDLAEMLGSGMGSGLGPGMNPDPARKDQGPGRSKGKERSSAVR